MNFHAKYIIVYSGYFAVGTEAAPHKNQLSITLHGEEFNDAQLPIFGNKVLGCYECNLEIHGSPRNPTWVELAQTANVGDTSIVLTAPVDWVAGEVIVVASSSENPAESERV